MQVVRGVVREGVDNGSEAGRVSRRSSMGLLVLTAAKIKLSLDGELRTSVTALLALGRRARSRGLPEVAILRFYSDLFPSRAGDRFFIHSYCNTFTFQHYFKLLPTLLHVKGDRRCQLRLNSLLPSGSEATCTCRRQAAPGEEVGVKV